LMSAESFRFLLVCTANICRSPMAEAAMRHAIESRGLHAAVSSAGVHALPDRPAHPLAIETVAGAGLGDLSGHRSRPLSRQLLGADFVLCMEHAHREVIVAHAPEAAGRVRLLGHWQQTEISDPVNGPANEFMECLNLLKDCTDQWLERLTRQGLI